MHPANDDIGVEQEAPIAISPLRATVFALLGAFSAMLILAVALMHS
jgi:hypothetical protein